MPPKSLNLYLTLVSAFYQSSSHAFKTRAAASWWAKLNSVPRPCDPLTWSICSALKKHLDQGARMTLTPHDFEKLSDCHALRLLGSTGMRPSELAKLPPASCHPLHVHTLPTKFAPGGRDVPLSRIASDALKLLLASQHSPECLIAPTQACLRALQDRLRFLIASDPERPPPVSLYALRHFFCTQLYAKGCSSAFIMQCMHHKSWATTEVYIHCDPKPWRCSFEGVPDDPFLPHGASVAPLLQAPNTTAEWLRRKRSKFVTDGGEVECVDDGPWDGIAWLVE